MLDDVVESEHLTSRWSSGQPKNDWSKERSHSFKSEHPENVSPTGRATSTVLILSEDTKYPAGHEQTR